MKIRSYFTILATIIVAIPVAMGALGWLLVTLYRSPEPLPSYDQLPRGAGILTDSTTWAKVQEVLVNRPVKSETYVFNHEFRLIYGSAPLGSIKPSGDVLTVSEAVNILQRGNRLQDIFLFQPAGTKVWIILVQAADAPVPGTKNTLMGVGIGLTIFLVLSIAVALIMGRVLATSVVRLEKAAQTIARGDLGSPVGALKGSDEVRSLGRTLESMRLALLEEEARQSRFVMGVSHDLKSPLAVIKGYVELLKDGPSSSPEARQSHFDLILDKADLLDGMIDHLIDYSKVNTGDWQQTWRPLALGPFLEEFCDSLVPDARLLGRSLVRNLDLPVQWSVTCDQRSVRRSLENLVHNALRYTEPGGMVGIQARLMEGGAEIVVWDDGPGLSPTDLPHLFDPFYRGTHSRQEPGMGLGLSIVKTILDSHGWTIRAESHRGARFIITLPAPT